MFSVPPVHQNKKAMIVTPTIRLMQDQVFELQGKGIPAVYLGSAQLDKHAEEKALSLEGDVKLIFVTPEWLVKPEKISVLKRLDEAGKISLIAIDEAHLVSD